MDIAAQTIYSKATCPHRGQRSERVLEEKESIKRTKIKAKILVVEDGLINQKLATLILQELGYKVDIGDSGKKALVMYQNGYQAILMNIGLPDISA